MPNAYEVADEVYRPIQQAIVGLGGYAYRGWELPGMKPHCDVQFHSGTDESLARLPEIPFEFDLDISRSAVTDAGMAHVARQRNLRRLIAAYGHLTDAALRPLAGHPRLSQLYLDFITDAGIEHLNDLNLEVLTVSSSRISDLALARIAASLPRLKQLDVSNTAVTDFGLAFLGTLTSLETLGLWQLRITDAGLAHLKNLTRLTFVNLSSTIGDRGLEHLAGLTELSSLNLSDSRIRDLQVLRPFRKLKRLILSSTAIEDQDFPDFPFIDWLTLSNTRIGDRAMKKIVRLRTLTDLDLSLTQVTDAGLKNLAQLTALRSLLLCSAITDDRVRKTIRRMKRLHRLLLAGPGFTDAGVKEIAGLPLQFLDIRDAPVTDACLSSIARIRVLRYLNLYRTSVSPSGLDVVRQTLPNCRIDSDVNR